ncbi:MAG: 30S ribosome-binding factor RbfA [Planctomyces sp.]|nr:30S ribosome-binding factor RbfA [Planctomyces sp.]
MSSRRMARVASVVREVVSTAILQELRDPRIRNVTVLGADISPDLRYARVRISVMGDEKMASLTMHGLNSARGYLQSKIGERIKSRYIPELSFMLDDTVKKSIAASQLIRDALSQESSATVPPESEQHDSDELSDPVDLN